MVKKETKVYSVPICHRCEHRIRFLEEGHGPRMECQGTGSSHSCYNFQPVKPLVLKRSDLIDKRPHSTGIVSSRSYALRTAKCKLKQIPLNEITMVLAWEVDEPTENLKV